MVRKAMSRSNEIYGNCKVLHPNGRPMFLCLPKRAKWYLDRDLATLIQEDPMIIQLTFEPKGGGNIDDEYHLGEKKNACVVCQCDDLEYLTKHHVVPREYRKWFPLEHKSRSSHDVIVMCSECHSQYERNFADDLKKQLETYAGLSYMNTLHQNQMKTLTVYNYAKLMMDADKILNVPTKRIEYFQKEMLRIFKTDNPIEVYELDVRKMIRDEIDEAAKIVVSCHDIRDFVIMWRTHFIESMNPKYMPDGWSIDYKY